MYKSSLTKTSAIIFTNILRNILTNTLRPFWGCRAATAAVAARSIVLVKVFVKKKSVTGVCKGVQQGA